MDLSGSYGEVHRQTQLIGEQMDISRRTSSGTPQIPWDKNIKFRTSRKVYMSIPLSLSLG